MKNVLKNAGVILRINKSREDEYKRSVDPYEIVFFEQMTGNAVIS